MMNQSFRQENQILKIFVALLLICSTMQSQDLDIFTTRGLLQWTCEDSSFVYDYVLRLDKRLGFIYEKNPIDLFITQYRYVYWRIDIRNLSTTPQGVEYQFSILGGDDGDTVIALAYPQGKSIGKQVECLVKEYPGVTKREISKHIQMVYDTIKVSGDEKLKTRIAELKKLRGPLLMNFSKDYDPNYQIYSQNTAGQAYFFLTREAVCDDEQGKRLLNWIDQMFLLLRKMSESKK